jgi:hypothetical protein
MVRTNLQEFAGDVHVLSNLQVGSNLFANDLAANVLNVIGSIGANLFVGDGGLLSNIATTLDDIIDQGNTVSNTIIFVSGNDATSNTGIITRSNVGISISNTEPTGEYQLTVGSNIFVNTHASNVLTVVGRIGSDYFVGDGGLLSNIATTLDQIVDQGNTISNTVILESGQDSALTSNIGLVSRENVGISVSNSNPTGEFQFGVGSNLFVNTYSSNVLTVEGNVLAQKLTFGTATVTSAYNLSHVTAQGSVTDQTISLTNATTGLAVTSNATVGGNVTAETVISTANVEVGDRLKFASNVFVDDLRVADVAANLVTYDKTTGELMDSGGLFANKLAVVSVQPPSALSANTTTIAKHGTYTVTTSSLAANSNAWNAFDGDSAVEWLGSTTSDHVYNGGAGTYSGTSNLFAGNYIQPGVSSAGEWLAVEFPYKTTLRHMKLTPPATYQQYPASANVYATNDSLTWTEVVNWSDVNPGDQQSNVQTIIVNATESYKKYAMVVTKTNGSDTNTALAEWKLFTESFSIDGGKVEMATSAVMGGETTMDQHGPHSRDPKAVPLKKYPEIVFDASKLDGNDSTNTYTQAGYTVSASSGYFGGTGFQAWKVHTGNKGGGSDFYSSETAANQGGTAGFIGTSNTYVGNSTLGGISGEWVKTGFPFPVKIKRVDVTVRDSSYGAFDFQSPSTFYIIGSHDGTTWSSALGTVTDRQYTASDLTERVTLINNEYYKYYAIVVTKVSGDRDIVSIDELEYYGYEEDPPTGDTSVDTTFTSIMNTPQTTGANVYVDGNLGETFTNRVTGPDATGPSATYDATGKYWELNGTLTSNIAVEANTFLEGDAPHSVSVWFNSSNLEANVSNTCVFSISDQEKLDSVNLDLQSNTWHNLTYAYQGEGGSRVTYLDGRKVAEEQAEDTFGAYPPFAMTGYSQGGYVASASSENSDGTRPAWKAFNNTTSGTFEAWGTEGGFTSGVYSSGGNSFTLNGSSESGHWLKLELPHKIYPSYATILTHASNTGFRPTSGFLIGSNDDENWDVINQYSALSYTSGIATLTSQNINKAYKYILLLIQTLDTNTGTYTFIENFDIYGHRENDLVRLPDPTNVLKYPHIAMTGPAQRGYVASASSTAIYNASLAPKNAFNGIISPSSATASWQSLEDGYNTTSPYNYKASSPHTSSLSTSTTQYNGEWLSLETPHKIKIQSYKLYINSDVSSYRADSIVLLGSDTTTNGSWNLLHAETSATYTNDVYTATVNSNTSYKYHRLLFESLSGSGGEVYINELEFYGTGVDSVPIQIGGGNIDKVANFRVYDKFVGEDQALEIWDAQKDEFGRAKSSMTLQKGRLGIGTTEPEGRLAVLDEPHNLEEFPPRAMTAEETYMEGHGVFRVSANSYGAGSSTTRYPWKAFIKGTTESTSNGDNSWLDGSGDFNNATGVYDGSLTHHNGSVSGEYLQLELPYEIQLSSYSLAPWNYPTGGNFQYSDFPRDFIIYGSKDSISWDIVDTRSGQSSTSQADVPKYHVNSQKTYKYFVIVVTKINTAAYANSAVYVAIGEWRLFGTREQGQSVLHDGQLTLTKSLNVPRIGPALDADDTPRRDRLVVEYNTSTNPTFEGAVRDTSGRGNEGVMYGNTYYDATTKAFRLDGLGNDYIQSSGVTLPTAHSMSVWINMDSNQSGLNSIMHIGTFNTEDESRIFTNGNLLHATIYGSTIQYATSLSPSSWYHVVYTFTDGTTFNTTNAKIYVNGQLVPTTQTQAPATLNLVGDTVTIGATSSGAEAFKGKISNPKLYDTILEPSEVKTLYDMGRCDEGHHVVNFSKTRVGIGLGDGEAPSAALGVRGGATFRGGNVGINTSVVNESPLTLQCDLGGLRGLRIVRASGSGHWEITNQVYNDLVFTGSSGGYGVLTNVTNVGTIDFTGQHRNFIDGIPYGEYQTLEGLIVSANKNKYYDIDENITAGANAIQISQSLPLVALSNVVHDKACFGVVAGAEDPETRKYDQGMFSTVIPKQRGDTRVYINSLGEGAIWVVNTNGSLEAGDYITTSNVAGYGQKQDSDSLKNYTVAKITMDCDFEPVTQPVQQILRSNVVETYYLGNVHKVKMFLTNS